MKESKQRWEQSEKEMTPGTASILNDFPVSVPQEAWATQFLSWFPWYDNDKSASSFIFKYTILRPQYPEEVIYHRS